MNIDDELFYHDSLTSGQDDRLLFAGIMSTNLRKVRPCPVYKYATHAELMTGQVFCSRYDDVDRGPLAKYTPTPRPVKD